MLKKILLLLAPFLIVFGAHAQNPILLLTVNFQYCSNNCWMPIPSGSELDYPIDNRPGRKFYGCQCYQKSPGVLTVTTWSTLDFKTFTTNYIEDRVIGNELIPNLPVRPVLRILSGTPGQVAQ